MSFSDFLLTEGTTNQVSPPTGSAVLNSNLSNPLTSSTQCRGFNTAGVSNNQRKANFFVSSSFNGGSCVNIPNTKSVSLRIWGRIVGSTGIGLCAKHNTKNTWMNGIVDNAYPLSGYEFALISSNGGTLFATLGGYNFAPFRPEINFGGGKGADTWIGLRMDIVPINMNKTINNVTISSPYKDIITLYTASLADPDNWIQIHNEEILTSDQKYVPWGSYTIPNNGMRGSNVTVQNSSYGFNVFNGASDDTRTYFDDFKIFVRDA